MNQRHHHNQQPQQSSSSLIFGSLSYTPTTHSMPSQPTIRDHRSGSPTNSRHGGIQFINETDSIIADSNGRLYNISSPMAASAAAANVALGCGGISAMGMPGIRRPDYLAQSDDSCDSYDEIDQLVYTSRNPRRRTEGTNSASGSSQVTNDGPRPGKKTKGRVKIKMEFIENKLRRYTTFSKRKTGIMKKAYELSTLTGTQVMLLVASETGHVYTFATRKLQPMITSDSGKALIQTCLNSPDIPTTPTSQASVKDSCSSPEPRHRDDNVSSITSQRSSNGLRPAPSRQEGSAAVTSSFDDAQQPMYPLSEDDLTAVKTERSISDTTQNQNHSRRHVQGHLRQFQDQSHSAKLNDDQSHGTLVASNGNMKRHAPADSECSSMQGTGCKLSKDSVEPSHTLEQKSASAPADKLCLPQPLFYKLPGSHQIMSLPALKTGGITPNGHGTLIYQTPQGLLLASSTSLVGAFGPEGCLLSPNVVTAAHHLDIQRNQSGATAPLLVTVSSASAADCTQIVSSSSVNVQSTPTDLRFQLDSSKR